MNKRLVELDSLRGLAALSVMIGHFMNITPINPTFLVYTPLRILWGGHEAVILFFILSGFVLSLPFYKGVSFDYTSYVIKRIFRIYVPYLVAMLAAVIISLLIHKKDLSGLSQWIDSYWSYPLSFGNVIQHVLLIFDFETRQLNPVIWSLVQEMRISLLFPIIMYFVIKLKWKTCMGIAAGLSIVSLSNRWVHFNESIGYFTSYFDTLHYISMFIFGALLAKNVDLIKKLYSNLSFSKKVIFGLTGMALYSVLPIVESVAPFFGNYVLSDWLISGGVITFIVMAIGSARISTVLKKRLFTLCGELSYSIYLYHLIILIALTNLFYGRLNIFLIYLLTLLGTFCISFLSWKYIEKPSMNIGKRLSKILEKRNATYKRSA
ncbi:acyltransferase [Bacillus sp. OK048]|uniref:acyltransferase family protein n=1 Tax=Bacillus sp. OK048 TaxID=1882761 RepID=UPI00087EE608|nr:acyltransferase [Bacillus sp. OK048]SDM17158.1 Peptidoglycan/LPS O-acetylase OafA/YrhL, contains acyltransferase and SGNH-hydrolase domains [Bacillus sp. OK048]